MTSTINVKRAAAFVLALLFAAVTLFSAASLPAYGADKPAKVSGVKAAAESYSAVRVTWNKSADAEKYQVYRAASKTGKYKKVKTTTDTSFTNKSLKAGKKYFYKVRAVSGSAAGDYSAAVSAKTRKMNSVTVDKKNRTVTIYAKVNGKYFKESTRHLMIDQKGFNKGMAILTSYCRPAALYKGLVKAGGVSWSKSAGKTLKNGEKISSKNAENKKYSKMDITVSWGNESHDLSEILTTKKGGKTSPKLNMVFSGNPKAAAKTPSGCMVCLDSCYIGIVSNSKYGLCVIDNGKPTVYARADNLPADGKIVEVTFKLK